MKKMLSHIVLSAIAISAIAAPSAVASAQETVSAIPVTGLYDVEAMTHYSFSDFRKLGRSEKIGLFKKNVYIVADSQGNTVSTLDVLTLSNAGLEKARTNYSKRTGIKWGDFVSKAKATINGVSNGKVIIEGKEYSVAANLQGLLSDSNEAVLKGAKISFKAENGTITNIKYLEITNSGAATAEQFAGNLVLDGKGATVEGDVIVNGSYISLKNLTIHGSLKSGVSFKDGLYTVNADVKGKTIIGDTVEKELSKQVFMASTAATSKSHLVFQDSSLGDIEISKQDISFGITGKSTLTELTISSDATITAPSTVTISKVTIRDGAENVELNAKVGELEINNKEQLSLTGQGTITTLTVTNKEVRCHVGTSAKITNLQLPEGVKPSDIILNYEEIQDHIGDPDPSPGENPEEPGAGGGGGPTPGPDPGGGSGPVDNEPAPIVVAASTKILTKEGVEQKLLSADVSSDGKDILLNLTAYADNMYFKALNITVDPKFESLLIRGKKINMTNGEATITLADLSVPDPQGDGVSLGTLRKYFSSGSLPTTVTLVDGETKVPVSLTFTF